MKKILIFFITLSLLTLTACGSATPSPPANSGDVAAPPADTPAEPAPDDAAPADDESGEMPSSEEPEPAAAALPADFWNQVAWTYTDDDGYVVEKQVRFSPLISIDRAPQTAAAAWTELGGSEDEIPDIDDCQSTSEWWGDNHYETGYYVMGTIAYVNKTDGFSFTEEKAHNLNLYTRNEYFGSNIGFLSPGDDSAINGVMATGFTRVFYSNGTRNYGSPGDSFVHPSEGIRCSSVTMSSDKWGPVRFIICIPDTRTPKEPNGMPELNDLYFQTYPRRTSEDSFLANGFSGDYASIHLEKIDSDSLN